ncbi:Thioredoxin-like protein [Glarea lozoyensis ATCC 20868]|uniref:Thioredoxin-like protein n=1 Tax=Glarea lozoyensis (strain ATCC 20868 / MF5171) TaxID=1116229 RepID=S3CMG2_GLAL2|nr:Thioredoxin-like protein [Glarea lozoyensis ATCC 20868]EPE26905.1 Thioredoxin-like protein [Glarea lozoyensis ATCC 20868]
MFAKLTTKIAMRKAGIPSSALSMPDTKSFSNSDGTVNTPITNPFANLSVPKSWQSWATPPPPPVEVAPTPVVGKQAPATAKLRLPPMDGRPAVVVFLRHAGCPFAEKTFIELRRLANKYTRLQFFAVSHSSKQATDRWISQMGGAWSVQIVVDEEREVYAAWGLGISTTYHLLNPWTQIARTKLGKEEGNWGREVDPSGNRWQTGGAWSTDELGLVRWGAANNTADDLPNLIEACRALGAA